MANESRHVAFGELRICGFLPFKEKNFLGHCSFDSWCYFVPVVTQIVPSKTLHAEPPLANFHDLIMGGLGCP